MTAVARESARLRKVGTSQDRVLARARSGKPDIPCNRKHTADGATPVAIRQGRNGAVRAHHDRQRCRSAARHSKQDRTEGMSGPLAARQPSGRSPRWMVAANDSQGSSVQNPAYRSTRRHPTVAVSNPAMSRSRTSPRPPSPQCESTDNFEWQVPPSAHDDRQLATRKLPAADWPPKHLL